MLFPLPGDPAEVAAENAPPGMGIGNRHCLPALAAYEDAVHFFRRDVLLMLPVHALAPAGAEPAPFVAWIGQPGLRRSLPRALSSGTAPSSTAGCIGPRGSASRTPGKPLPASRRARGLRGTQKRQLKKSCLFSMAKARFSARGMACYIQEGISPAAVTPPPSGSRTGAAVRRSLRRGSCSSRYPPPSENNPSSRNERSPIFLMDTEIIAGSAHPGQQTAENIRKFSRRFRPDYTTFRPPRVNRRA